MTAGWIAGAARVPLPVPIGTPMAGYAARTGPATGTLDELTVGALHLGHGNRRFVLVAADLAAVEDSLVDDVAAAAELDRSELVLCASHTHSGPAGVIARMHPSAPSDLLPALRETFVRSCVAAIDGARRRSEPVDLLVGEAETSGLAGNRNAPDWPFDPRVSVLATRNRAGRLTAAMAHFACHPTILSAENRLLSADFPGALRRVAEPLLTHDGTTPVVLFVNGAAGDISTRFTRTTQDYAEVERVGRGLAEAVEAALGNARAAGAGLESARVSVSLEPRRLNDVSGPEATEIDNERSAAERRRAETRAQGALLLERLAEAGPDAIQHTFDVCGWRLGDVRLVAIPGELFASLGARIVQAAPGPVFVLGYANGYVGYLVDREAEAASTYEALASPFAAGAGDVVAEAAETVIARM
jgi:hypothetical protein